MQFALYTENGNGRLWRMANGSLVPFIRDYTPKDAIGTFNATEVETAIGDYVALQLRNPGMVERGGFVINARIV